MEYESRRDADDAYHEMHNKRIGRDDMLKIEVGGKDGLEHGHDLCVGVMLTGLIVGAYSSICFLAI